MTVPRWKLLMAAAAGQHNLFTAEQAQGYGVNRSMLSYGVQDGRLRRVQRGVYAFGGAPPSQWEPMMAAVLAAGPDAVLSHRSAAVINRVPGIAPIALTEISVPRGQRPRLPGVTTYQSSHLPDCDVQRRRGVLVTTPPRTMVDLAGVVPPGLLEAVLDEGSVQRLWTYEDVRDCLVRRRAPGRAGLAPLRTLLAARLEDPRADSQFELRVISALEPLRPFEVHFQVSLDGELIILDVAWPWWKAGVEADGWSVRRRSRRKFDRGSRRANLLLLHDWRVLHVTSAMSDEDILGQAARLVPAEVGGPILRALSMGP